MDYYRLHKKGALVESEEKVKYPIIMTRHLPFRKESDGTYGTDQSAMNTQADPCPRLLYRMYLGIPFHELVHDYYIRTGYGDK